jgi:hypothetical protein
VKIYTLLLAGLNLAVVLTLTACAYGANQNPLPSADYPDVATPAGFNAFNGGIIADVMVRGVDCNIVTDDVAMAVEKWQSGRQGFQRVNYKGHAFWAIPKAVIFQFDKS